VHNEQCQGGDLLIIEIDTQSQSPLYEQLRDQVVFGIASMRLAPCEALPSVRRLAADLGINFHTVNKAYSMLCDEGYIVMERRKGALVAQTIACDEAFVSVLKRRLALSAAEAACRDMSEEDFIGVCAECYRVAKGNSGKGGVK
jgi:DNA-binding transcriptional regulator YhcF (GntR family)